MPYSITTKDGITIDNIPDNIDPNDASLKQRVSELRAGKGPLEAQPELEGQPLPEGQPVPEGYETYHDPMQGTVLRKIAPERTIGEKTEGVYEAGRAIATGSLGGLLGQTLGFLSGVADAVKQGKFGEEEGAHIVKKAIEGLASKITVPPEGEAGKEYTQAALEFMAPLEALTPLAGEIGAVSRAIKPAVMGKAAAIAKPLGEEVDLLKAAIPETEKVKQIKIAIKENPTSKEIAPYKIEKDASGFERVVSDVDAKEAMKQGFEDRVVSTIKSSSPEDRKKMLQMINIHKLGKKSANFAAKNRPADIIGKTIEDKVSYLSKQKKQAGNEIENYANELKGKQVNYEPAVSGFVKELEDIGVKISPDETGKIKIDLRGSDIEGDIASKQLLNTIFSRLVNTDVPDAYGVHRAKRFIDTQVSYGKTKANPLSKTTENIVKGLRRNLNQSLGEYSEGYKNANTKYSDIIGSLDDIQKAVGTKADFDSPNAAKTFGTSSRKILSNYGSRTQMLDALDSIDKTAKKYGMDVKDDIVKQVIFVNELDRMFGSPAGTSFKGQIEQALSKGTDIARRGVVDSALDIAKSGLEKARGINEENAIKAMEKVLKSQKEEK